MAVKLNIGAGKRLLPADDGWVNVDAKNWDGKIDLVIDLEKNDLPYEDSSIDEIYMADFLEHLCKSRQLSFLRDVFRVMRIGAKFFIQLPDMGTAAERYCGVLKDPTELQHNIDGATLAEITYGGQEYEYNYHKWGYDQTSLRSRLESLGFSVWWIRSDGGMNMTCYGAKPCTRVVLPFGGGLGDTFQTYLASPTPLADRDGDEVDPSEYPSGNGGQSMWLKRIRLLKDMYPDVIVKAVVKSSNLETRSMFDENPYIDEVELRDSGEILPSDYWYDYNENGYRCITRAEYLVENFAADELEFYTKGDQQKIVDLLANTKYVVLHPTAGMTEREVIDFDSYVNIANSIVEKLGYKIVILGTRNTPTCSNNGVLDLRGKHSASAGMQISVNASGFVGTHSCQILCAWYSRIPSVCIVPTKHDNGPAWIDFMNDDANPTTWGFRQSFSKTLIVDKPEEFDTNSVITALLDAGLRSL